MLGGGGIFFSYYIAGSKNHYSFAWFKSQPNHLLTGPEFYKLLNLQAPSSCIWNYKQKLSPNLKDISEIYVVSI